MSEVVGSVQLYSSSELCSVRKVLYRIYMHNITFSISVLSVVSTEGHGWTKNQLTSHVSWMVRSLIVSTYIHETVSTFLLLLKDEVACAPHPSSERLCFLDLNSRSPNLSWFQVDTKWYNACGDMIYHCPLCDHLSAETEMYSCMGYLIDIRRGLRKRLEDQRRRISREVKYAQSPMCYKWAGFISQIKCDQYRMCCIGYSIILTCFTFLCTAWDQLKVTIGIKQNYLHISAGRSAPWINLHTCIKHFVHICCRRRTILLEPLPLSVEFFGFLDLYSRSPNMSGFRVDTKWYNECGDMMYHRPFGDILSPEFEMDNGIMYLFDIGRGWHNRFSKIVYVIPPAVNVERWNL